MKIKTKLTSLIIAFVLLASLLVVGVWAVKETSLSIGGNINFTANGANAEIKLVGGTITNGSLVGQTIGNASGNKFSDIALDNNTTSSDAENKFSSWSGLNLAFNEAGDDLSFQVSVKNTAQTGADNYLCLTALADKGTAKNATVSVKNNAGGITALLYPQETATFTVTFKVKDKGTNASLQGFAIDFDMEKKALAEFPTKTNLETSEYEFSEPSESKPYTIAIGAKGASEWSLSTTLSGDIVIPDYVADGDKIYAVTKIANYGFMDEMNSLIVTNLTLPNTLRTIGVNEDEGMGVFSCTITNKMPLVIPQGVTYIGYGAFEACTGFTGQLVIPEGVTHIESGAFRGCSGLTGDLIIPDSVTNLGSGAFEGCTGFTGKLVIPEGITGIYGAFTGCTGLTGELIIPEGVTQISDYAFTNCLGFTGELVIPDSVVEIDYACFSGCGISSVIIPESVTTLKGHTFEGCSNLTIVTIPKSMTSIANGCFDGTNLTTVKYRGTEAEWTELLKNVTEEDNDKFLSATVIYNYTFA